MSRKRKKGRRKRVSVRPCEVCFDRRSVAIRARHRVCRDCTRLSTFKFLCAVEEADRTREAARATG